LTRLSPQLFRTGSGGNITFTSGLTVTGSLLTTGSVGIGTTLTGADGIVLTPILNYSWAEGSGNSYANIFRQRNTAATATNVLGTATITTANASTTGIDVTFDVDDSNIGSVFVILLGGTGGTQPTISITA
jgi:hypothetical protein